MKIIYGPLTRRDTYLLASYVAVLRNLLLEATHKRFDDGKSVGPNDVGGRFVPRRRGRSAQDIDKRKIGGVFVRFGGEV